MTDRPELPPQSRITCRIDGSAMTMVIPRPVRLAGGWLPPALLAAFGFLSITFTIQGVNSQKPVWFIGGLFFGILAGGQLLAYLGPILKIPAKIKLQITPEILLAVAGPAEAPIKRHWLRTAVAGIRAEPPKLNIYLKGNETPVCLLSDLEPAELEWIAEQIRVRWERETG